MMSMLPFRAWCPRYCPHIQLWLHSTCNCSWYRKTVIDGFSKFCNELLPSTSRTSHLSRQAISPNPEETDRICCHRRYPLQNGMGLNDLSSCASRANFRVRVCRFTSRMADSATPLEACSPTGLSRKTNSTKGVASKVAVLRATIDGSPSLWQDHAAIPESTHQGHQPRRGTLSHST